MATYKVIQDIEADDKLVGPFGIRQFIYLLIVAAQLFIAFQLGKAVWFLALPFLPPIIFFALLAMPIGGGQPTEVWLLAKLRFLVKPRIRLWAQESAHELVTITAPKAIDEHLIKDLSQAEVKGRLQTLASTLDTHGWASKHLGTDPFAQAATATGGAPASDRLVSTSSAPEQTTQTYDASAENDILDEQNNPTAQKLGQMINQSNKARRKQIESKMKQQPNQPQTPITPPPPPPPTGAVVTPKTPQQQPAAQQPAQDNHTLTPEELLDKIHKEQDKPKKHGHMRVIKTLEQQEEEKRQAAIKAAEAEVAKQAQKPVTSPSDPDIINLARSNDLNVETVARQMKKKQAKKAKDEIVINLHDD